MGHSPTSPVRECIMAVAENFDEIDLDAISQEIHARVEDVALLYGHYEAQKVVEKLVERWRGSDIDRWRETE